MTWMVNLGLILQLGLHRFRVSRSGRVLGQSSDALEVVVDYKAKSTNSSRVSAAGATRRSSDGCSLSLCLSPGNATSRPPNPEIGIPHVRCS